MASRASATLVPLHRLEPKTVDETEPEVTDTCPECGGRIRTADRETACASCGLIIETDWLDRSERRYFPSEGGPDPRHAEPTNTALHNRGLGSEIGSGPGLNNRQRQWHRRCQLGKHFERNRATAFGEIHRLVSTLELPDPVRDTACRLFRDAHDADLARGHGLDHLAAAVVVAAGRIHGTAVTHDAVERHSRAAGRRSVYGTYQDLVETLGVPVPPPDATTLVAGVTDALDLPAAVRTAAERWCRAHGDELVGSGRNPKGVAAAAVYDAANGGATQDDVADAAGVTPVTLRACWQAVKDD